MPELPEVETVVRSVAPQLIGRTIEHAEFRSKFVTRSDHAAMARSVQNAVVQCMRRRGKQIIVELNRGYLYIHLGMTGKLLLNTDPGKHAQVILKLDQGTLIYDDIRQFGRFEFFETWPDDLDRIGPDALKIPFDQFYERLREHSGQMKPLLLNQSFLGGLGNIYVDELLFRARIHPRASARRISRKRAAVLHAQLLELLDLAITHRGSSISDYVDGAGERGSFQQLHQVYGRAGEPCLACGGPIRRIVIGQRGTHYCPRCQRP